MKLLFACSIIFVLSACDISVSGMGDTDSGIPITGQYTVTPTAAGNQITASFISERGASCTGVMLRKPGELISSFPISCTDKQRGTGTFTSDFINSRDTLLYRMSNGQRGKIVFGVTNLNAS